MSDTVIAAAQGTAPSAAAPASSSHAWKDGESFGFHDFLDLINPLQHLPIIGSIYRWATGDEPGNVARVAGDTLYGGPIGFALGLVATATEDDKGRDLGERTLAALFGSDDGKTPSPAPATATASAAPAAVPSQNAAWLAAFPNAAKDTATMASPAQVAALYGSAPPAQTTPSPTQSQAAAPVLDHPPMPLFRKVSAPSAAPQAASTAAAAMDQNPAARAFFQRTAMLERQISTGRNGDAPQLNNHPVPLQLSGGLSLPAESAHPVLAPPSAAPSPQSPPAAPAQTSLPQAASPVAATPSQFSQKMLDALDKYHRLQQQLDRQNAVDSVPGGAGLTP